MRLIDADELERSLKDLDSRTFCDRQQAVNACIAEVIAMPTIDAEPVKYGKWSMHPIYKKFAVCNKCGMGTRVIYQDNSGAEHKYNYMYCPNCGAKMDEPKEV